MDILVIFHSQEKLSGNEAMKGVEHFTNKKDFLKAVGVVWDTVKEYPEIKCSFQLNNMESDC